jgi:predicted cupin superfamily sugar epimerase
MDARAAHLISSLGLVPHPEGGYYREVHRSSSRVRPVDARDERTALTTIYFLLVSGDVSRWHRVASDEAWHYLEGDALELMTADADFTRVRRHVLGCVEDGIAPIHVVRAHEWQASRTRGAYTLAGCTVGPGFEFADFQMLRDDPALLAAARARHPSMEPFV